MHILVNRDAVWFQGRCTSSGCNHLAYNWALSQYTLQWGHNGRNDVSNYQPKGCLVCSTVCWSKKTSKLRVTGLCAGYSPVTGECPAQMASNAENVSIWWRHHEDGLSSFEIPYDRLIGIMGRPTPVRRHFDIEKAAYSSHIVIKHALQHSVYAFADNQSSHCSERKVYHVIVYCNKTFFACFLRYVRRINLFKEKYIYIIATINH